MKYITIFLFLYCSLKTQGQDAIPLTNPSFEEMPDWESGWKYCGGSQPVIQPGNFKVENPASEGQACLALVVRDDSIREAISQKLPVSLQEGQSYQLHADLARAELYIMEAPNKSGLINYATPVKLRVWGGNTPCEKLELLHTTPLITTTQWLTYTMALEPQHGDYDYLILEATHHTSVLFLYNGNLLIDNLLLTITRSNK